MHAATQNVRPPQNRLGIIAAGCVFTAADRNKRKEIKWNTRPRTPEVELHPNAAKRTNALPHTWHWQPGSYLMVNWPLSWRFGGVPGITQKEGTAARAETGSESADTQHMLDVGGRAADKWSLKSRVARYSGEPGRTQS